MGIIDNCRDLAEELCRYSRLCYDRRLVGAAGGNLSVRADKKDVFLVTASGVSLRDVAPENIVVVDVDGNVLEAPAGLKPSKEIGFHLAIFKVRPQTNAVLHVHPAYSTIYANTRRAIPPATVSANLKLKQGRIVLEARPGSQELSGSITTAVQEASQEVTVLLLERHGLIAFNSSLCNAFDDAELAEDTAKIAFMSSHLPAEAAVSTGKIVDLTAPLDEKTHCYPTDPPFKKNWHITFDKNGMNLSKLEMSAHSGTHVDAPFTSSPETWTLYPWEWIVLWDPRLRLTVQSSPARTSCHSTLPTRISGREISYCFARAGRNDPVPRVSLRAIGPA